MCGERHKDLLLPGVPVDHVFAQLQSAGGNEIESGKLASPESSAALAVNTFGWFVHRPGLLPPFPSVGVGVPASVDVEFCARFPWRGGRHPWLDAVVVTKTHIVGVESKRFEPFRGRKAAALSHAYDRPVWGDRMKPIELLRDHLRLGETSNKYLDATQLVKHAFGLVTEGRRRGLQPHLHYIFAEPACLGGRAISAAAHREHREELRRFSEAVDGAEVSFSACSYRDWIAKWSDAPTIVAEHGQRLLERFQP